MILCVRLRYSSVLIRLIPKVSSLKRFTDFLCDIKGDRGKPKFEQLIVREEPELQNRPVIMVINVNLIQRHAL